MPRRIISLTTDFGLKDHFVGTMKGVIYGIAPGVEVVDIAHDLAPFEITEGAFTIAQAYRYFPKKTIHVVVIDPGVGTARRPILVEAAGQYFIAPDNGVLSMIYSREKHKARHITASKYFLEPVSDTFHGRDIFSPCAAHLARGTPPARFGKTIADHLKSGFEKPTRTGKRIWSGNVLKIDRFGNLITNFHIAEFPVLHTRPFALSVGPQQMTGLARTFAECAPGEAMPVVGSSGYIEIVANQASAAKLLGCATGAPVELTVW